MTAWLSKWVKSAFPSLLTIISYFFRGDSDDEEDNEEEPQPVEHPEPEEDEHNPEDEEEDENDSQVGSDVEDSVDDD